MIAQAYVKIVSEARTRRFWSSLSKNNDYRGGWMCYHWQTLVVNGLGPIMRRSECFRMFRVGLVKEVPDYTYIPRSTTMSSPFGPVVSWEKVYSGSHYELAHNWVAITAFRDETDSCIERAPLNGCTVYLDPWRANGNPEAYVFSNGKWKDDHPAHNFIVTDVRGENRDKPEGVEGRHFNNDRTADTIREFLGWKW
jgi:hypothetical protein